MTLEKRFTVRVRLILFCADHVLIAHHIPTKTNFMPGGGLEHGESAIECLLREIEEECDLQLPSRITPYGILENRFVENGRDIHEVLIHFTSQLQNKNLPNIQSREVDLKFTWLPIDNLNDSEIWPPETHAAILAAKAGAAGFHYAPLATGLVQ
jgi:8-oxo-dGTP pyrophosphatase MutT (NUDIX family)